MSIDWLRMDAVCRRLLISGRVQGVGFRANCRVTALDLGVCGTVANRADGTVEVVAEGPPASVDRLVEWCRSGPRHAHVNDVDVAEESPTGVEGFRIVY